MDDPRDRPLRELDALYADRKPPPDLEERAVAEFRRIAAEQDAVHASRDASARTDAPFHRERRTAVPFLQLAAAILLFLAGYATARFVTAPAPGGTPSSGDVAEPVAGEPAAATGRRYMLLLWERPGFAADIPPARIVREYTEWARATASAGIDITGHELGVERVVVRDVPVGAQPAEDERVGGFFIVAVPDAAAARRLAAGHPHIGYGGWIEIAEVL